MDEIIRKYRQGKFQECLDMIRIFSQNGDFMDDCIMQNNSLVCQSVISVFENDLDKMLEIQEELNMLIDRLSSLGMASESFPSILILNVTFNFLWWLLFYSGNDIEEKEMEEYLEFVDNALLKVLGKNSTLGTNLNVTERIIRKLYSLKSLILKEEKTVVLLTCEIVIVVLLFVLKLKRTLLKLCTEVVSEYIEGLKETLSSEELKKGFLREKPTFISLFKFGFNRMTTLLSDLNMNTIDYLYLLESVFLFSSGDFKGSLKSLQKNIPCNALGLWNYLGVLNSFNLKNWDLCSGFLSKGSSLSEQGILKARFFIMYGKLNVKNRNHKQALKQFQNALNMLPSCPTIYYCIGQEHGKMGLYDMMVGIFEDLLKVVRHQEFGNSFMPNFETAVLNWIHSNDEIAEPEALYVLAISYILNEKFQKAAEIFENFLRFQKELNLRPQKEIELPNILTILHEASITNLLTGNLVRAEQLALEALDRYIPQETPNKTLQRNPVLIKDANWLKMTLQRELLESDLEPRELKKEIVYFEDAVYFFSQNVIALLILSEIYRIQELENYKIALSKVYSLFCKYLTRINKEQAVDEDEKRVRTLVKVLAGKTCLRIAMIKEKQNDVAVTEKLFKRALCCNRGDKDTLYNYYKFLLKSGKNQEALKLWRTFYKEETTIFEGSIQSFSVRYFLEDKVFKQDLEKIQKKVEEHDFGLT